MRVFQPAPAPAKQLTATRRVARAPQVGAEPGDRGLLRELHEDVRGPLT